MIIYPLVGIRSLPPQIQDIPLVYVIYPLIHLQPLQPTIAPRTQPTSAPTSTLIVTDEIPDLSADIPAVSGGIPALPNQTLFLPLAYLFYPLV